MLGDEREEGSRQISWEMLMLTKTRQTAEENNSALWCLSYMKQQNTRNKERNKSLRADAMSNWCVSVCVIYLVCMCVVVCTGLGNGEPDQCAGIWQTATAGPKAGLLLLLLLPCHCWLTPGLCPPTPPPEPPAHSLTVTHAACLAQVTVCFSKSRHKISPWQMTHTQDGYSLYLHADVTFLCVWNRTYSPLFICNHFWQS